MPLRGARSMPDRRYAVTAAAGSDPRWFDARFGLIRRLWHSPTATMSGGTASRALSFLIVVPLLLTRLSPSEIAVWYLFSTIMGLQQVLADMGFAPTFTRLIAYAMGGIRDVAVLPTSEIATQDHNPPNWPLIE